MKIFCDVPQLIKCLLVLLLSGPNLVAQTDGDNIKFAALTSVMKEAKEKILMLQDFSPIINECSLRVAQTYGVSRGVRDNLSGHAVVAKEIFAGSENNQPGRLSSLKSSISLISNDITIQPRYQAIKSASAFSFVIPVNSPATLTTDRKIQYIRSQLLFANDVRPVQLSIEPVPLDWTGFEYENRPTDKKDFRGALEGSADSVDRYKKLLKTLKAKSGN